MYMNNAYPGAWMCVLSYGTDILGWDAWTRSDQQIVWKMYGTFMIVVQKGSMYGISTVPYIYHTNPTKCR